MFALNISSQSDERAVLKALGRSLAIIEFDPSGTILSANENFCNALGCRLPELRNVFDHALTEMRVPSPDWSRSNLGSLCSRAATMRPHA